MFNISATYANNAGGYVSLGNLKFLSDPPPKFFERYNSIGGLSFTVPYSEYKRVFVDYDARWVFFTLSYWSKPTSYNAVHTLYPWKAVVDYEAGTVAITLAFGNLPATYRRARENQVNSYVAGSHLTQLGNTFGETVNLGGTYRSVFFGNHVSINSATLNSGAVRMTPRREYYFDLFVRIATTFRLMIGYAWQSVSSNNALGATLVNDEALRRVRMTASSVAMDASTLAWLRTYQVLKLGNTVIPKTGFGSVPVSNYAVVTKLFQETVDFTKAVFDIDFTVDGPSHAGYMFNNNGSGTYLNGTTPPGLHASLARIYALGGGWPSSPSGHQVGPEYDDPGTSHPTSTAGFFGLYNTSDFNWSYGYVGDRRQHTHLRKQAYIRANELSLNTDVVADHQALVTALYQIGASYLQSHRTAVGQDEFTIRDVMLPYWGTQFDTPLNTGFVATNLEYACPNLFIGRVVDINVSTAVGPIATWGYITGYEYTVDANGFIKADITISQNPYSSQYQATVLQDVDRRINRR